MNGGRLLNKYQHQYVLFMVKMRKRDSLITCSDLTVRFGDEVVLEAFSCRIAEGKHTILKGESGSGKSTLLKLFLGFLKPTGGSIQFNSGKDGRDIRRDTAWLPQDLDLGSGTVEEVIRKPFCFATNQAKSPGRETYMRALRQLGLSSENLEKPFRALSTGQRQRVGLAICHLLDKPILLLDEPTSALDRASKRRAADILLAHTKNKTIVSTSHDPFWIEYADNIIELS